MNEEKWKLFLKIARTLNCRGVMPLLYGSLGLWHRTGEAVFADDIDVLLPETWLSEQWSAFQTLLQAEDWRLIDAHEHTFEKRGVHCSFAALEELETFAGVPISEIETRTESGAKYRLLSVKQYLAVYKASAKDGYRVNTRGKKDAEKIALLENWCEKGTLCIIAGSSFLKRMRGNLFVTEKIGRSWFKLHHNHPAAPFCGAKAALR